MAPRVVWPAPGYPQVCYGDTRTVRVIVAHAGDSDETLRDWATGWDLDARAVGGRIPLALQESSRGQPPEISGFAALPEHRDVRFAELTLLAQGPLEIRARRSMVYDLVSPRGVERARSVAWFAANDDLRLAFASDIHVAAIWDDIADAVRRYASDLWPRFVHPGTRLRAFVDEVNQRAQCEEVDAVVFGGDLIDHVYTQASGRGGRTFDDTNLKTFLAAIDRLEVPSFVIPGNHDYRLYPWRPHDYALHSARVPRARRRSLLEQAGWWDRWPLRWSDLRAFATKDDPARSPLHHYLTNLSPTVNYDVQIGSTRLVFLDAGRDIILRLWTVAPARLRLVYHSLPSTPIDPDLEGLNDQQLAFLTAALDESEGVAIFCHAPLMSAHAGEIPEIFSQLDLKRFPSDLAFELWLARHRARCGVLFHNTAAVVRLLQRTHGPLTWFGGHVHRRGGYRLDKRTGGVSLLGESPVADESGVNFIQTPSLGLHGTRRQDDPGHLLATMRGGRLTAYRYYEFDRTDQLG